MSGHVWLQKKFTLPTAKRGWDAFLYSRTEGLSYAASYRFAGYFIETMRQSRPVPIRYTFANARSYATGRNRINYEVTGRRMVATHLSYLAGETYVTDGTLRVMVEDIAELESDAEGPLSDYLEELGITFPEGKNPFRPEGWWKNHDDAVGSSL